MLQVSILVYTCLLVSAADVGLSHLKLATTSVTCYTCTLYTQIIYLSLYIGSEITNFDISMYYNTLSGKRITFTRGHDLSWNT